MRAWNILLLMLMAALAGCSSDDGGDSDPADDATDDPDAGAGNGDDAPPTDDDDTAQEEPTDDTGDDPPGETNETAPPRTNTPPTALVVASIEQGQIPFNVTYTLDGEDVDGGVTGWTFDADGDGSADTEGTTLPANFTFSYASEGLFTANLTVTDGEAEAFASVTINATAAAASAAPVQVVDGSFLVSVWGCLNNAYLNALSGTTFWLFTPDPATYGGTFTAEFTTTAPSVFNEVHFWGGGSPTGLTTGGDAVLTGEVPDGSDSAYLSTCPGGDVTVHYEAFAPA